MDIWAAPTLATSDGWVSTTRHVALDGRCYVIAVRRLFAGSGVEIEFSRGHNPWRFDSAEQVAIMESRYGPTVKARERLTAAGRWDECRAEIVAMVERRNDADGGGLLTRAEYLVTVGRKTA
ncbi:MULTISPECIES: hypothetical protein [Pseudofrankia]|uniref:hypothetical protein n=1 Tax=Pseudofrankia TaxID=2994363 RepID=UPI000234B924|nr:MULTISPECIES: hypothetical protein [Pseudofrankia]OHV30198.1 hypothetical protein BCD49_34675 [Pseudofrankia sp. EUN1h]